VLIDACHSYLVKSFNGMGVFYSDDPASKTSTSGDAVFPAQASGAIKTRRQEENITLIRFFPAFLRLALSSQSPLR
jgi:hypothetical protein